MGSVSIRFYEELNDFLPVKLRKRRFDHAFKGRSSVKDLIESIGVPHTEIDMILANGISVDFSYLVRDGDDISIYPQFESFDIKDVQHLRAEPLRNPRFIADVHLGKCALYLRILGFDTAYSSRNTVQDIVRISLEEARTVLTRDRKILRRNEVLRGYWIRSTDSKQQVREVISRFQLQKIERAFSRCLLCNSELVKVEKSPIETRLPSKVKSRHEDFMLCPYCNKLYWKGSHCEKMTCLIEELLSE